MYGLVNKAVVDLVVSKFGEEKWQAIKKKAEVDVDVFVSMDAYPDDLTYRLVGAASEVLKLAPEQVLEAFGQHWVLYTAAEGYGPMLDASGKTLKEFKSATREINEVKADVKESISLEPGAKKDTAEKKVAS